MRKIKLFVLSVVVVLFSACHDKIWDSIGDLDSRVTKLEELCKEMNTNITSLQTIVSVIQENDFITGIVPIEKGGEVIGYTIMFGKHEPITIYNGEDGKDGQNGSGSTPIIGVIKDTDGVYYWTLNGEWLLDAEGNKLPVSGKNGNDGENGEGSDGESGTVGKDGVTPQLKIENGYWYVSYDNGTTWTELGKAVGEDGKDGANGTDGKDGQDGKPGADGKDGQDGDSMFTSVTYDENNVYFTLTDGSVLIVPRANSGGVGENDPSDIIEFKDLNVKSALLQMDIDINVDGEISYGEAAAYTGSISMRNNKDILSFKEFQYFTGASSFYFSECSNLFEINLPTTLTTIEATAFKNCTTLRSIIIPQNVVRIKEEAFSGCSFLMDVTLPNSIISIEKAAFAECNKLSSFKYPENLISLDNLFYIIQRGYVKIPNNITTIYWNAIDFIQPLIFSNGNRGSVYGIGFDGGYITNVVLGEKVKTIPAYFCYNLKRLKEITIPNSVTKIEECAFGYCDSLKSIIIPDFVTDIKPSTFSNCISLASITLGNGITSIGNRAFSNCTSLINITIPEKVNKIDAYVFYQCKNLKTIYCKATTPPTLEKYSIPETIEIIYVPNASLEKYRIKWSDYADKIVGYNF